LNIFYLGISIEFPLVEFAHDKKGQRIDGTNYGRILKEGHEAESYVRADHDIGGISNESGCTAYIGSKNLSFSEFRFHDL